PAPEHASAPDGPVASVEAGSAIAPLAATAPVEPVMPAREAQVTPMEGRRVSPPRDVEVAPVPVVSAPQAEIRPLDMPLTTPPQMRRAQETRPRTQETRPEPGYIVPYKEKGPIRQLIDRV